MQVITSLDATGPLRNLNRILTSQLKRFFTIEFTFRICWYRLECKISEIRFIACKIGDIKRGLESQFLEMCLVERGWSKKLRLFWNVKKQCPGGEKPTLSVPNTGPCGFLPARLQRFPPLLLFTTLYVEEFNGLCMQSFRCVSCNLGRRRWERPIWLTFTTTKKNTNDHW